MKGFRDFCPEDKRIMNYIFTTWKEVALKYGYEEIDMPILEEAKIYSKSGQEIPEQIYRFRDKAGREVALRPETTPSIARMINNNPNIKRPIKWFSISQCYRYEQIQKGRSREFFQFNLDFLGSESMQADAEVIVTLIKILEALKLTDKEFYIKVSNRKLLNDYYKKLGIEKTKEVSRLLDKRCKISEDELRKELGVLGIKKKQIDNLFEIFKIRYVDEVEIESEGLNELKELFSILKIYDASRYCKLDLSVMRGFDYYTSTVFEAYDSKNKLRSIAGGGRYDNLADIPGVGYAMGDIVLSSLLESKGIMPKQDIEADAFIIPINTLKESIEIVEQLRNQGLNVGIDLMQRSISKNLEYVNKKEIPYAIIVGEDELKKKKIKLKNMKTGNEEMVTVEKVASNIKTREGKDGR